MTATRPTLDPTTYCREARRLRSLHRHDLPRMYRRIKDLSPQEQDQRQTLHPSPTPGPAALFARQVQRSLTGPVLRYSLRQQLLSDARKMGIGRFEANLIIATVQHRKEADGASLSVAPTPRTAWLPSLLFALLLQALVILAAIRLFV
jgi:hypothetical protein